MRKINPDSVRDDFEAAILSTRDTYREIRNSGIGKKVATRVAELFLMSAVVQWEGFLTDLFAAYINRDSTVYRAYLEAKIKASVKDKFGEEAANHLRLQLSQHVPKDQAYALLDPRDRNLSFPAAKDLVDRAGEYLAPNDAAHFVGLSASDRAAINAWIAVRNFVAHRSDSAKSKMNDALVQASLGATLKRAGNNRVQDAGVFLKATAPGSEDSRLTNYLHTMRDIARRL